LAECQHPCSVPVTEKKAAFRATVTFPLRLVTNRKENNSGDLQVVAHRDTWVDESRGPEEASGKNSSSVV